MIKLYSNSQLIKCRFSAFDQSFSKLRLLTNGGRLCLIEWMNGRPLNGQHWSVEWQHFPATICAVQCTLIKDTVCLIWVFLTGAQWPGDRHRTESIVRYWTSPPPSLPLPSSWTGLRLIGLKCTGERCSGEWAGDERGKPVSSPVSASLVFTTNARWSITNLDECLPGMCVCGQRDVCKIGQLISGALVDCLPAKVVAGAGAKTLVL